jgi:hypothetical protein
MKLVSIGGGSRPVHSGDVPEGLYPGAHRAYAGDWH